MNLRPDPVRHIELTKHLSSLKSSLSPDERKFEPLATERFSSDETPPGEGFFFIAIVAIIFWAATIGYFLNA